MALNQVKYPMRSTQSGVVSVTGAWLGGGAATNCTRVSGRDISSINYNSATGKYIITFRRVGKVLDAVQLTVRPTSAHANAAAVRIAVPSAFSATNRTLEFLVVDLATPSAVDLAATDNLHIDVTWRDSEGK